LAGQVQVLEQSKIKLEMSTAAMIKEHKREMSLKVGEQRVCLYKNHTRGEVFSRESSNLTKI